MDSIRLRRMAALIGSAALLASMTVATAAAPAAAKGKCLPFPANALTPGNCYYATERVDIDTIPAGVTLTGTDANDVVANSMHGTFNGGRGNDNVTIVRPGGTFNGGKGNDEAGDVDGGTFNGGPGDDKVSWVLNDGTFNGGPGEDCAREVGRAPDQFGSPGSPGTFAGGGGSDTYEIFSQGDRWSASQGSCFLSPA